jgi:hypothetical protein
MPLGWGWQVKRRRGKVLEKAHAPFRPDDWSLEDLKQWLLTNFHWLNKNTLRRNKKIREELMLVLLALRKKTFRKNPGFMGTLEILGYNHNTVKSWFYRGNTAKEIIKMLEPAKKPKSIRIEDVEELGNTTEELLRHCDRMAGALVKGYQQKALHLAREYLQVRQAEFLEGRAA